jgi:hypothetical protein
MLIYVSIIQLCLSVQNNLIFAYINLRYAAHNSLMFISTKQPDIFIYYSVIEANYIMLAELDLTFSSW